MMDAAHTSEISVDNYFTRQYIPEDKSEQEVFCPYAHFVFPHIALRTFTNYRYQIVIGGQYLLPLLAYLAPVSFYTTVPINSKLQCVCG
jgi:hypothetical protein